MEAGVPALLELMFYVIFRKDSHPYNFTVLSSHATLEQAAGARGLSGDIVTDDSFTPVQSLTWLWPWELADETCYAQRMIQVVQRGLWRLGPKYQSYLRRVA